MTDARAHWLRTTPTRCVAPVADWLSAGGGLSLIGRRSVGNAEAAVDLYIGGAASLVTFLVFLVLM
ncbi:MAG: hypothetical protein ACK559_15035, partial [bacterium]